MSPPQPGRGGELNARAVGTTRKRGGEPIEEKTAADYGVDVTPRLTVLDTREPAARAGGIKVASVDDLVVKLKDAGVLK